MTPEERQRNEAVIQIAHRMFWRTGMLASWFAFLASGEWVVHTQFLAGLYLGIAICCGVSMFSTHAVARRCREELRRG